MVNPRKLVTRLPRSRKLILAASTGLVVLSTSSVLAFNGFVTTGAEETPLRPQVDDHEQRITKTERDLAETKDRVGKVEQRNEENAQRVGAVERQVVVVQQESAATAGQVQQLQDQAATPAPAVQSAPQPEVVPAPPVNPRIVVAVTQTPQMDRFGKQTMWLCSYELHGQKMIVAYQEATCSPVGTEISNDLALMNGLGR
ncbi:hypothetical protein RhoFasB10_03283 [Rhodococcus sp. B10]|nr:hypothetical protein [Rhodococcus sp. B10]